MKTMSWLIAAALSLSAPAWAEDSKATRLNFDESASVIVKNDTLNIRLTIAEEGKNRQAVSRLVTQKLNLVQAKIKQNKAVTSELGQRYTYPKHNDKNQLIGWQDSVDINLSSTDFEAMTKLVSEVQNHAMVRGVDFSLSREKRRQAVEQASEQALKSLRQRAEFITRQLGFSKYKLVLVNLNDRMNRSELGIYERRSASPMAAMSKTAEDENMEIDIDNAGEQEIYQNISVTAEME